MMEMLEAWPVALTMRWGSVKYVPSMTTLLLNVSLGVVIHMLGIDLLYVVGQIDQLEPAQFTQASNLIRAVQTPGLLQDSGCAAVVRLLDGIIRHPRKLPVSRVSLWIGLHNSAVEQALRLRRAQQDMSTLGSS